jgi:hypothetical protein
VRVTSWGLFVLGIYLIIVGLDRYGFFFGLGQLTSILALVAGILLVVETWRR